MKKIISMLLSIAMFIGIFGTMGYAEETEAISINAYETLNFIQGETTMLTQGVELSKYSEEDTGTNMNRAGYVGRIYPGDYIIIRNVNFTDVNKRGLGNVTINYATPKTNAKMYVTLFEQGGAPTVSNETVTGVNIYAQTEFISQPTSESEAEAWNMYLDRSAEFTKKGITGTYDVIITFGGAFGNLKSIRFGVAEPINAYEQLYFIEQDGTQEPTPYVTVSDYKTGISEGMNRTGYVSASSGKSIIIKNVDFSNPDNIGIGNVIISYACENSGNYQKIYVRAYPSGGTPSVNGSDVSNVTIEAEAEFPCENTGGWDMSYAKERQASFRTGKGLTGVHDVIITFVGAFNLKYIKFNADLKDAYTIIDAVEVDNSNNVNLKTTESPSYIAMKNSTSYAVYNNVDFGNDGLKSVDVNYGVSKDYAGGEISFWILGEGETVNSALGGLLYDSNNKEVGIKIATLTTKSESDDWNNYITTSGSAINGTTVNGVHDVYMISTKATNIVNFKFISCPENYAYTERKASSCEENANGVTVDMVEGTIEGITTEGASAEYNINFDGIKPEYMIITGASAVSGKIEVELDDKKAAEADFYSDNTTDTMREYIIKINTELSGSAVMRLNFDNSFVDEEFVLKSFKFCTADEFESAFSEKIIYMPDESNKLTCDQYGKKVKGTYQGGYIKYDNQYFGEEPSVLELSITYSVPENNAGGEVRMELDNNGSASYATIRLDATTEGNTWDDNKKITKSAYVVNGITGVHDVYFTFYSPIGQTAGNFYAITLKKVPYAVINFETNNAVTSKMYYADSEYDDDAFISASYDNEYRLNQASIADNEEKESVNGITSKTTEIPLNLQSGINVRNFIWNSIDIMTPVMTEKSEYTTVHTTASIDACDVITPYTMYWDYKDIMPRKDKGWMGNSLDNSYVFIGNVDFGEGVKGVNADYSKVLGGDLNIYVDSIAQDNLISVITIPEDDSTTASSVVSENVTGVHDMYIVFTKAGVCDLKTIQFTK